MALFTRDFVKEKSDSNLGRNVERETFGRLLRVRGRRTRKSELSRLIGMRVSRYCLLTKFLTRVYDNERLRIIPLEII